MSQGLDTRGAGVPDPRGLSRRSVVRGAAWTVPVIATAAAAPAFAASCVELYPGKLDWASNYTRASATAGQGVFTANNGQTITLNLASVFTNYTASTTNVRPTDNFGVTPIAGQTPATIGGIGAAALTLTQVPNATTDTNDSTKRQAVSFNFVQTVYRVEFTITDIDSSNVQYDDAIGFDSYPAGTTVAGTPPTGSTVTGTGTLAAPFRQNTNNTAYDNFTDNGGNVNVVITNAAGFKTFRLIYWNRLPGANITTGGGKQTTYISSLTAYVKNAC